MRLRFTWDPEKERSNRARHGVSFVEALTVFRDPRARIHDDPAHSSAELREIIVGHSDRARLLLISFTERGSQIRIIRARRATRRERRDHEEGTRN
jgi:uncharacterized DUF497 family protein